MTQPKLIILTGPTASGKTALAIKLARKFRGEIISADSRQVYRGMDLGSGKVTEKEQRIVKHYLLDIASPKQQFTVAQYKKLAQAAIKKIIKKNKIPFLVGGTPLYINALIYDWQIPDVKPNTKLRKKIEKKSTITLYSLLKKLDPKRAKNIDKDNKRRLIRAIEIIKATGQPVPELKKNSKFNVLILGMKQNPKKLRKLIATRLKKRLKAGMVSEVKKLIKNGVNFRRLEELGLEYRYIARYLQRKITREQMIKQLKAAIYQFSRRQMTWFRKMPIVWVKNQRQAEGEIKKFLF